MVLVNDFELHLVSAEDKNPFKEHQKAGKTYVEVEPGAEYFLSIQKLRRSSTHLSSEYKIDGRFLGYMHTWGVGPYDKMHTGLVSRSKGVEQNKALKFIEASFSTGNTGVGSTRAGMGTVEVVVSTAIYDGQYVAKNFNSSFAASTIKFEDEAPVTMKKNVRSDKGHCQEETTYDARKIKRHYRKGDHRYTITLYYCATPGLIAVGILPKPPAWEWLRMIKPSNITAEEKEKLDKAVISEKHNRNGNAILELADSDSDSDDEDSGRPDRAPSTHKKART